jgi:tetratricopeptide (TPR) repeat protein
MWIDLDDEIEGVDKLPDVLKYMDKKNFDDIWFQYDYIRRVKSSEPGSIHWRDRIIKTDSGLEWSDDAVHETVNAKGENEEEQYLSDIVVRHRKTVEQQPASLERNRIILEKDWIRTHSASTAWYLGTTLKYIGDYEGAIEKLAYVTENGEGIAFRFLAWLNLCECYLKIGNFGAALDATDRCIAIDPDHPAPWYQRFTTFKEMGNYDQAMESGEIAMNKKEGKLAILLNDDPTLHYRGKFTIAQVYLSIGNIERAYQLYSEVKKIAPGYIEEQDHWSAVFEEEYSNYDANV